MKRVILSLFLLICVNYVFAFSHNLESEFLSGEYICQGVVKTKIPASKTILHFSNFFQEDIIDVLVPDNAFFRSNINDAAKGGTKLLNQFNSVESLLQNAGKFSRVKGGAQQAFVKGDGASIFKAISQGGTRQANGTILMKDGTTLFNHFSSKTGAYTMDINRAGQIFKIRITP